MADLYPQRRAGFENRYDTGLNCLDGCAIQLCVEIIDPLRQSSVGCGSAVNGVLLRLFQPILQLL
jgi:hypothetical protein